MYEQTEVKDSLSCRVVTELNLMFQLAMNENETLMTSIIITMIK